MTRLRTLVFAAGLIALAGPLRAQQDSGFAHSKHARLFLSCLTCHAGARDTGQRLWPASAGCANCHDGQVVRKVDWSPPTTPRVSNLRFTHSAHSAAVSRSGSEGLTCETCHARSGAAWMDVGPARVDNCFNCHGLKSVAHLSAPDTVCLKCHLPLPATRLPAARVADFPTPPSHEDPAFAMPHGHARLAQGVKINGKRQPIAPSCTVCHAQDFCAACHANSTQVKAIQAMARDPRSLALGPKEVRPAWHGQDFSETHASIASASAARCATCHQRSQCLDCHRPNPADGRPTYHNTGYLARHPAEAYSRASDCSQCHNTGYFCTSCHKQSGLVATGPLTGGYHNSAQFFTLGHGKAAREALETCVSCHTENDCMRCHSAVRGRSFNPHGPGFDASRLKARNRQMCTACHGSNVPG